jgi:hypothetical protein
VSATQTLSNKTLTHCDATTQTPASNNTKIATTAYVDAAVSAGGGGGTASRVCEGRLTLASGTPVTSNDIVGATNLFFTPYRGNNISLWSGTAWQTLTFNEIAMPLSGLTANLPYDVFALNNAGTVVLERLAWTSGTARATALTTQNGVLVRSGDATRRYLGTFCATGTTTTEDSALNRYVWNYYHRAVRVLRRTEMTGSWTYSTASWRQANGSTSNRIGFVIGVTEDSVTASVQALANNNTTTFRIAGVSLGIDSLTPGALVGYALASILGGFSIRSQYTAFFTPGLHYIAWLEYGAGSDTQIWYGGTDKGMEGIVLA